MNDRILTAPRVQGVDLPIGDGPRCSECTHPLDWHDENGCRYGRGGVHGGCSCKRPHGKKRRATSNGTPATSVAAKPSPFAELGAAARELARSFERFATAAESCGLPFREMPFDYELIKGSPVGLTLPKPSATTLLQPSKASPATSATHHAAVSLAAAKLPGQAIRLLAVIANEAGSDGTISYAHLATASEYKSRTISTYVRALRNAEYIDGDKFSLHATTSGVAALGDRYKPTPKGGDEMRAYWLEELKEGPRTLLEIVCRVYPKAVTYDQLREFTEYGNRTITTYARELLHRRLVTRQGKSKLLAADVLFLVAS